ncbi:hypothetical protein A3A93_04920 [Candidatus Roizmanbacteria bacterium RIFCSPLOWO2_01_FULL_38_12]|uniref:Uncharacterized protein n=1 Tax=Candidatus Roizmanbacteria bacterium RIFCSPLOWO2_01_FULL_38_12 TaxID=1802061 RepID=A0A1F7J0N1_9BACT|nr:MAG: hypothetical protein A3A93_04920 [Candidatus Roizmanbacteria bacterium RIFCSPLOWO2_01_FULL_38_12]
MSNLEIRRKLLISGALTGFSALAAACQPKINIYNTEALPIIDAKSLLNILDKNKVTLTDPRFVDISEQERVQLVQEVLNSHWQNGLALNRDGLPSYILYMLQNVGTEKEYHPWWSPMMSPGRIKLPEGAHLPLGYTLQAPSFPKVKFVGYQPDINLVDGTVSYASEDIPGNSIRVEMTNQQKYFFEQQDSDRFYNAHIEFNLSDVGVSWHEAITDDNGITTYDPNVFSQGQAVSITPLEYK